VSAVHSNSDYVARARSLAPLLAGAASRTEAARELADDVVAALHDARLFRVLLPSWLDGGESQPSAFIETIEAIARGDASTAWCLCQMNVCSLSAVYLSREAAQEVFGPIRSALAWGNTPHAKAVRVDGGYRVTGEWDFGSGCHHATWLGGHCPVIDEQGNPVPDEDGLPAERTVLFPKSTAKISDVWRTIGLRGTGSDRYSLDGSFVPERHAITTLMRWPDQPRREMAAPYCFGGGSLYASGFGAVALGKKAAAGTTSDACRFCWLRAIADQIATKSAGTVDGVAIRHCRHDARRPNDEQIRRHHHPHHRDDGHPIDERGQCHHYHHDDCRPNDEQVRHCHRHGVRRPTDELVQPDAALTALAILDCQVYAPDEPVAFRGLLASPDA
jgi:hypothetical protein